MGTTVKKPATTLPYPLQSRRILDVGLHALFGPPSASILDFVRKSAVRKGKSGSTTPQAVMRCFFRDSSQTHESLDLVGNDSCGNSGTSVQVVEESDSRFSHLFPC